MFKEFKIGTLVEATTGNSFFASGLGVIFDINTVGDRARVHWSNGKKTIEYLRWLKKAV